MNEPWTVDLEDVPRLIEAILSPQRTHSLIMVSPPATPDGRGSM